MDKNHPLIKCEPIYLPISANRHENSLSCRKNFLLYSSCHCPVIYDIRAQCIRAFLHGHTSDLNGQQFVHDLESSNSSDYIISTAYDKTAIIWEVWEDEKLKGQISHKLLYQIASPNDNPFVVRSSIRLDNQFLTVTATLDGTVYLWNDATLVKEIKTEFTCLYSTIHIVKIKQSTFIFVLLACSDNKIHIFQMVSGNRTDLCPLFELVGHHDWIKSLDTLSLGEDKLAEFLLASASQDAYVRVWHMKLVDHQVDDKQIRTTVSQELESHEECNYRLTATLETVLSGHEGIIHGLCWFKKLSKPTLQLISCSADKTIVIWKSSATSGDQQQLNKYDQCPASAEIWKESVRVGETGETNLPFLSVCLAEDETTFFGHSLRGAIHSWKLKHDNEWVPDQSIVGHFGPVTDLAWERSGSYLLSSSLDRTCRLHAIAKEDNRWHELARPLVHGHEINCIASLGFTKFVTGSEEKTIRAFEATQFFLKNHEALAKLGPSKDIDVKNFPAHAQLPALGLSNRGAQSPYDIDEVNAANNAKSSNTWYEISKLVEKLVKLDHLDTLPIEEVLLQSTLWWESNKIFGHGNELYALAIDSTGSFLASASKANRADLANVFVWECSKFRKTTSLEHHTLTVTRLRFSPNDKYLLSVSRDRTWCLSIRTGQLRPAYKKLIGTKKSNALHDRIIWDCCWTHDSKYFVTVSRDKKAIIWPADNMESVTEDTLTCSSSKSFESSIQAVDSSKFDGMQQTYLLAFGLEGGSIELNRVTIKEGESTWQHLKTLSRHHHLPIRRLAFQPETDNKDVLLASAGDDCSVKLTKITMLPS